MRVGPDGAAGAGASSGATRCSSETFAVRLAWACGYFAEMTHFVASGTIDGVGRESLQRARTCIDDDGAFRDARFELDDPDVEKLFEEHSWSWNDNPFVGTPQLTGLKVLLMLISDWDNKDRRDVARGSNTAIFVHRAVSRWRREAQYLIIDWGGSMGRWGGNVVTRGRWDPAGFAAQTPQFVTGVGRRRSCSSATSASVPPTSRRASRVDDVRWLCRYLGRITDDSCAPRLQASGATPEETERFAASLRDRIDQLSRVAAPESHDNPALTAAASGPVTLFPPLDSAACRLQAEAMREAFTTDPRQPLDLPARSVRSRGRGAVHGSSGHGCFG